MKIYRRSAPFGSAGGGGLYFLAFACAQERIDIQLQRMYGLTDDGLHDRLIEYSRAVTGSYWYVPSADNLGAVVG
jgi:putative iron-dependent peroxidase